MLCRTYEKLISDFLDGKMDYMEQKRFLRHTEQCPSCKEELVIQFLVKEGMASLEDGDVFDLQAELSRKLLETRKRVNRNDTLLDLGMVAEAVVMLAVLAVICMIIV